MLRVISVQKSWQSEWHPTHLLDIISLVALNASAIFPPLCVFIKTVISAFSKEIEPRLLSSATSDLQARDTSNRCAQANKIRTFEKEKSNNTNWSLFKSRLLSTVIYPIILQLDLQNCFVFWICSISIWKAFENPGPSIKNKRAHCFSDLICWRLLDFLKINIKN